MLLRRGQGIGTFTDSWTPYTGPDKQRLIEKALEGYLKDDETERSGTLDDPVQQDDAPVEEGLASEQGTLHGATVTEAVPNVELEIAGGGKTSFA